MADCKLKFIGRSASTESTEYSTTMGRSVRRKKPKPKERWLLTRKTWRYMADAGRKLIPEGAQNRPEDVPKIEAYFQEICKRETKFLLWRKNSYPGAIGFRSKKNSSRKAGSCRKALSVDEVSLGKAERPTFLDIEHSSTGKFDVRKMKEDFLNKDGTPTGFSSYDRQMGSTEQLNIDIEDKQLINMLEQYLRLAERDPNKYKYDFNYQDLVHKLQSHLNESSRAFAPMFTGYTPHQHVHFQGDHGQRSTLDTLSRYYAQSGNRDKIISDLLTDRKALEKLYFELRKTKGFRGSRGGTGYTTNFAYGPQRSNYENTNPNRLFKDQSVHESPLIEVQGEASDTITYHNWATQTLPIPESVLLKIDEEYKKLQEEKSEEEPKHHKTVRRRSSVENDDISQSVSDTIKRYLRMARKKSVDVDKADRFKRVNYDRTLRNIKAKGEITKPGDDDGLNKGCQTNDDWILTYRSLKFADMYDVSDVESRFSSSRSSIDIGIADEGLKSPPLSPPAKSHSFLSHLLHGKHDKHDKSDKSSSAVSSAANMQKSKSSSSVMHHGGRLMAKKIFRSRSKSQTRPAQAPCKWTPQGSCKWTNVTGRQVVLSDTSLLHLTDVERKVLQKVAIAKLQALNLGVAVKVPSENVAGATAKPKRRPHILKRKALTTGIFDANRKENDKEKDRNSPSGGMVFGIPLTQCVENDRLNRAAMATSPFRSRTELVGGMAEDSATNIGRHGSRASFSSLIDAPRGDEKGSCENLMLQSRMVGSVPGLLDSISCSSAADIPVHTMEEESSVPNILSECFRHLETHGLHTLGIFRVSTSKKRIRQLREDFDCGKETTLENDQCPHDVATLLKEYLRDLPDPLLCRELYHAFVNTQKIRNRKLQLEALQHLVQLLPLANRDTLYALLSFLSVVARYSDDSTGALGELITGNKMDSNNLATVFAPNILHCIKPGAKDSDKPEDRIDIITVVRTLIDQYKTIFNVSAELLDEVYVHMMDSYPEVLDQLLNKRDASAAAAEESVDELDSESNSAQWSPVALTAEQSIDGTYDGKFAYEQRRTYSREEFLHESAATGGPNIGMRIRHKDRIRERSTRKKREKNEDGSRTSSTLGIISRLRGQKDDDIHYTKNRSSSLESNSSIHMDSDTTRTLRSIDNLNERRRSSPYILDNNGVIKASLTIPVHTPNQPSPYNVNEDIPYIEDGESSRQQFTVGVIKSPTAPPRRRNHSIGSDSSITSSVQPITGSISVVPGYDSAVGSSVTYSSPMQQNTPSSVSSSIADAGVYSSPTSWASSPPTSPDSTHISVNFIPDDIQSPRPLSRTPKSVNIAKDVAPTLQKVSFSSTQEVQQIKDVSKSHQKEEGSSSKSKHSNSSDPNRASSEHIKVEKEPRFTASITNIGNDVMKSKKAEFERIIKVDAGKTKNMSTGTSSSDREKKKYTKRRYTDSRHQTRHIPDAETVDLVSSQCKQEEKTNVSQSGPVYKRRELISSAPSK